MQYLQYSQGTIQGYDRGRQWMDYEMEYEIFFGVYVFLLLAAYQNFKECSFFTIKC